MGIGMQRIEVGIRGMWGTGWECSKSDWKYGHSGWKCGESGCRNAGNRGENAENLGGLREI